MSSASQTVNLVAAHSGERETTLRVLIVEDSVLDAELLVRALKRAGLATRTRRVVSEAEFLASLDEEDWDLVLADYRLPQFSAPAALKALQRSGRDLPFIVVSGTLGEEAAVDVMRAGAHDFMIKGKLDRLGPVVVRELRDAGERRKRREAEAALHVSEARLQLLVDGIQDYAIVMIDAEGRALNSNPAAERILGYTNDNLVGQDYRKIFWDDAAAQSFADEALETAARTGCAQFDGWRCRGNGERFWSDTVLTALWDAGGRLAGYCDVTRDRTARRLAEEERTESLAREQAARAEAEAAVRARDEFLAIASHELRTPLTAVSSSAQLLKRSHDRGLLDEAYLQHSIEMILNGTRRLNVLTEDLLDVSRLQEGRLRLRSTIIDLRQLIEDCVEECISVIGIQQEVKLDLEPCPFPIRADAARLEQVVTNILGNAAKYSKPSSTIEVVLRRQMDSYMLSVRDQGIGLPAGANKLIFRPFGRAPNSRRRHIAGMGLGLYVCRQIAEAHGGSIVADSPGEEKGTTVTLSLPRPVRKRNRAA